ncbi:MAG TPA: aldehyde dehydrogenase [Flavobacterium sp.]|jgi:aldehyde dehydrogenase (NAD+)
MNFKSDIKYRKETLKKLLYVIQKNESAIIQALYDDFKKPAFEAVLTETNYVISDLQDAIRNIDRLSKPKRIVPSLLNFPSTDYIYSEPYGRVLIIAPWNYPFQLALCPLIAAVAAGNSVILKPSELTPNTATIISQIISETFDPIHVEVFQGGPEVSQRLLRQRWNYIFFTGSFTVGKLVAKAAAEHLTPVTLELGGKNPCIVDESANLQLAAKRIVWGKFLNAGQTCIAPDYLLVHESVKSTFSEHLKEEIVKAYGENPELSPDFPRIINPQNYTRLSALLQQQNVIFGGQTNNSTNYISPTLIDEPALDSPMMEGEIFGPLLPILSYRNSSEIENIIALYEKPLALYVFTRQTKFAKEIISKFSFGGGCINDTVIHFANKKLPFGGVGHSGTGAYHGESGFHTFSHKKSIVKKANWLDIPIRYAPYHGKLQMVRKILKWF